MPQMWNLNIYKYSVLFVLIIATLQQKCDDPGFTQSSIRVTHYYDDEPQNPAEVQYFCHKGYQLVGSRILTCQSDGNWSSHQPICIRGQTIDDEPLHPLEFTHDDYCKDPGVPTASVRFTYYTNTKFELGTQVKFTCNEGYVLWGRSFITCEASGKWSAKTPHCKAMVKVSQVPKSCTQPDQLENGAIVYEEAQPDRYLVGAQISYMCYENFRLKGPATITCTSEEKWDNPVPECIPEGHRSKLCKPPEVPQHGTYTVKIKGSMLMRKESCCHNETVLQYRCTDELYALKVNRLNWRDTFRRYCLSTGSWSATEPKCEIVCGRSMHVTTKSPFIIFGEVSGKGAFPWHAAISLKNPYNLDDSYITCGGVLISSQWVLTAAHCVCESKSNVKLSKESILIHLGKFYRDNNKDDSHVQEKQVADIYVHENYNSTTAVADIALILLESTVTFTEWVIPACLPSPNTDWPPTDNQYGIVTGWGWNEDFKENDELKKGLMQWTKPEECNQYYNKSIRKVLPDMYCAVTSWTDVIEKRAGWTCQGDSGGAMVFARGPVGNRRYVAEGLVSWSDEFCKSRSTVFVQIRNYVSWIASWASIETGWNDIQLYIQN